MIKIAALIAVLLLAAPARAIELSLEENRGERGSVGYVDMQRLFTNSPDAQRAKEGFEDLVRQAEERVNLRKAELLRLRQALDSTRAERDALAASMAMAPVPSTAPAPAPAVPVSTQAAAAPAPAVAPAAVAVSTPTAPALSPAAAAILAASAAPKTAAVSTAAAPPPHPRELSLPGMATTDAAPSAPPAAAAPSSAAVVSPAPPAKTAPAGADGPAAVVSAPVAIPAISSTTAAAAAVLFPGPAPAPAVAQAPAGPSPAQRLLELDSKIINIQADIARKESELMHEHDDADRGLLDVESRKTDQVLARLYRAVSEVARRDGVSVVIDKTTILYGHQAVDLTDKVLKYLRETPAAPAAAP